MQLDLYTPTSTPAPAAIEVPREQQTDGEILRRHLAYHKAFRTRAQIQEALGWTDRQVRDAAEQLGDQVVRCQAGFKLVQDLHRDDLGLATQACDAFISQGKRMIRYAVSLRRQIHRIVG